jgi:nucleoside-diphosphate-sugar epimerase
MKSEKKYKILVTGGAGMIGSNLVKKLVHNGYDVFVADNLWRGKKEYLFLDKTNMIIPAKNFYKLDLRDYENCLKVTNEMDIVVHLADIVAGINYVFSNESSVYRSNLLINTNTLRACITNKVKKYIYAGTACSYPKSKQSFVDPPPFKEEDVYPAEPESAYGWSKLMGEYEAELAFKEKLIDIEILRLHNVYGSPAELDPSMSQVIPALCRKAIEQKNLELLVWGSGRQKRAFVHVDDVVDGFIKVINRTSKFDGVIQLGPDYSTSIAEIAERIVALSGKKISIKFDKSKPEGDFDRMANNLKAKNLLNWSPKTSLNEGLEKVFNWCKLKLL